MKKKIVLSVAALCIILTGCGPTQPVEEKEPAVAVEVMKVATGEISNHTVYAGKVTALEEANVFSTVPGKVGEVFHDVGDRVKQGDVLFQMDTKDLTNQLNVLKASLQVAEANVNSAKTAVDTANGAAMQTQMESAKSGLANAELAYHNQKREYDKNKQLFEAGVISQSQMDQIQLAYDNALVAYEQAKKTCDITVNQMPQENERKAQDGYQIAAANRDSVQAQIVSQEKTLADANVKSPLTGVVTANHVVAGTVLSQTQPAFTVMDMSKVEIQVGVSEQVVNTIHMGETVDVKVTAVSNTPVSGKIVTVSPAADADGTYETKIQLENANGKLKVGMLGEVYFEKEQSKDALVIPRNCVITKNKETYVYVVEKGIAHKKEVTLGIDTGETVEITKGVSKGMQVVTKGQTYLKDGVEVSVNPSQKGES